MNKNIFLLMILLLTGYTTSFSQEENAAIRKGNNLYKQGKFEQALPEYRKALTTNPGNPVANFNFGNTLFKKGNYDEAAGSYDNTINNSKATSLKEKGWYNKGVAFSTGKKLEESIEAYKNALKLDPNDEDARFNLQKALHEQKKKEESGNKKKEDKQNKQKENQQKKKTPQSKLNRKQVENLLRALQQKEEEVQKKMQRNKARASSQPEKDW